MFHLPEKTLFVGEMPHNPLCAYLVFILLPDIPFKWWEVWAEVESGALVSDRSGLDLWLHRPLTLGFWAQYYSLNNIALGVPAVVQWVKNPTASALRVQSLAWRSGLKDPTLLQLWPILQLRFNPWPGNFHELQVLLWKRKQKPTKTFLYFFLYFFFFFKLGLHIPPQIQITIKALKHF